MKKQNRKIFLFAFLFVLGIFLAGFSSAAPMNTTNYTISSSSTSGIQVSEIRYTPYPANPGEYFDIWIQANLGSGINYARFQMGQDFPFSIDNGQNDSVVYKDLQSQNVVMHFKVRVSKDAVSGENTLPLEIFTSPDSTSYVEKDLNVYVTNAQTSFATVVQDESSGTVSLALANVGENTANSVIVKIPEQNGYRVDGTNGQMVGNLNSGDYSIVNFNVLPVGRNTSPLEVEIDYTDNIGVRREVFENVTLSSTYSSNATAAFSGSGTPAASGASGNYARLANFRRNGSSGFPWLWIVVIVVVVGGGVFFAYKKYPETFRKVFGKDVKAKPKAKENEVPEWLKKAKEKSAHGK